MFFQKEKGTQCRQRTLSGMTELEPFVLSPFVFPHDQKPHMNTHTHTHTHETSRQRQLSHTQTRTCARTHTHKMKMQWRLEAAARLCTTPFVFSLHVRLHVWSPPHTHTHAHASLPHLHDSLLSLIRPSPPFFIISPSSRQLAENESWVSLEGETSHSLNLSPS